MESGGTCRLEGRAAPYLPATGCTVPGPTKEELQARIAELEAEVGARKPAALTFKVSEKGGVSVYG